MKTVFSFKEFIQLDADTLGERIQTAKRWLGVDVRLQFPVYLQFGIRDAILTDMRRNITIGLVIIFIDLVSVEPSNLKHRSKFYNFAEDALISCVRPDFEVRYLFTVGGSLKARDSDRLNLNLKEIYKMIRSESNSMDSINLTDVIIVE